MVKGIHGGQINQSTQIDQVRLGAVFSIPSFSGTAESHVNREVDKV